MVVISGGEVLSLLELLLGEQLPQTIQVHQHLPHLQSSSAKTLGKVLVSRFDLHHLGPHLDLHLHHAPVQHFLRVRHSVLRDLHPPRLDLLLRVEHICELHSLLSVEGVRRSQSPRVQRRSLQRLPLVLLLVGQRLRISILLCLRVHL